MSDYSDMYLSDYLGKAYELGQEDRYEEAFNLLNEAADLPPDMLGMDGMQQIGRVRDDLRENRSKRARQLRQQIRSIMEKTSSEVSDAELVKGDDCLARLASVQSDVIEWENLNRQWQKYRERVAELRDTERVEQYMNEIEGSSSLHEHDRALLEAQRLVQEYPDSERVRRLLDRAKKQREDAYRKTDELITQAEQGNYDALIEVMLVDKERGVRNLPAYILKEGKIAQGEMVSADEAIDTVMKLRTRFHNKKIREYIDKAEVILGEGHPAAALKIVEEAKEKFIYADTGEKQRLDQIIKEEIEPAIARRELARDLALEAQKKALQNPEEAWNLLQEARSIDDLAPDILRVQQAILPHLKVHLEKQLQDADEKRYVGELEVAELTIDTVLKFASAAELSKIETRAKELKQKCTEDKILLKSIIDAAGKIEEILDTDLEAAQQLMLECDRKIAGRPDYFRQPLNAVEVQIKGRLSIQEILKEMQRTFDSLNPANVSGFLNLSGDLSKVEVRKIKSLQRSLKTLQQEAQRQKHKHEDISRLLEHIQGRLHLVQGRLEWNTGSYKRALLQWQECSRKGNDDDRTRAKEWIVEAKDASAVNLALKDAEHKQKEKDFNGALESLKPWLSKASPRQEEVRTLHREIKSAWIEQLQAEIESGKDGDRRLNAQEMVERLDTLRELDAQLAKRYVDKQVEIYHNWAKQTPNIKKKIEYYQKALQIAGDPPPAEIEKELFWVQRKQFLDQLEDTSTDQDLDRLKKWIVEHSYDVPTRLELIRRLFKLGNSAEAAIKGAERHLEEARQKNEPFTAGLASNNDLLETELRLQALKVQSQSLHNIDTKKEKIQSWLTTGKGVIDYHYAANALEELQNAFTKQEQSMISELSQNEVYNSLDTDTQKRVKREWDQVRSWLNQESRSDGELHQWFNQIKDTLLAELQELWEQQRPIPPIELMEDFPDAASLQEPWKQQRPIPVADMVLKAAAPEPWQMERLRIGLRIRYLNKEDEAGKTVLKEFDDLEQKLKKEHSDLVQDVAGPEFDLQGKRITSEQALEKQREWAATLQSWAKELDDIYNFYHTTKAVDAQGGLKKIAYDLDNFYKQLVQLERKKNQVLCNLDKAKRAGDITSDGHSWQDVPWRQMLRVVLRAQRASMVSQSAEHEFLQQLDVEDGDVRDKAWEKAADVLSAMQLDNHVGKAPWQDLNKVILDAKIDERWESVLDPISDLTVMAGHRVLKWLQTEVNTTQNTRNRLVLAAIFLYVLVQAERFTPALEQMDLMKKLDKDNDFGFQTGTLIKDPTPLTWDALENKLTAQKQQWETFQSWWRPVESSALRVWEGSTDKGSTDSRKPSGRERLISYVKEAKYEDAYQLAVEALYGVDAILKVREVYDKSKELFAREKKEAFLQKLRMLEDDQTLTGETNSLGGGLALAPLLRHLERRPDELISPKSRRMEREMEKVKQRLHDVKESISEVRFWLDGHIRPQRLHPDLAKPVPDLQEEYDGKVMELDDCIKKLNSRWWPFGRKKQREYCQEILDDLKAIAPDRNYDDYESWI